MEKNFQSEILSIYLTTLYNEAFRNIEYRLFEDVITNNHLLHEMEIYFNCRTIYYKKVHNSGKRICNNNNNNDV